MNFCGNRLVVARDRMVDWLLRLIGSADTLGRYAEVICSGDMFG